VFLVSIVTGVIAHALRPLAFTPGRAGRVIAGALIAVAVLVFGYAARTFATAGTPVPARKPTTVIVTSGPYRFSRNPIYLAFTLFQFGLALWVGSWWLIITLVGAGAIMHVIVIPREERYLAARFGREYLEYQASVRRWL
jgi:protein-S-isoprenylcysteine O-methyltransferase Ste14